MLKLARTLILYPLAEYCLGRDIRSKLKNLREFESQTPEERSLRIKRDLFAAIDNAGKFVPYYRDLFRNIGFQPDRLLRSTEYLQEIPLLDKEILRQQGIRMLDERFVNSALHTRETNGSTGLTTTVWYDQISLDWTAAANLFASEITGCPR
ncbi:MAG: phenylacetate--CoA ligase family protein, partial [Proteobacteria bacterium]